MVVEFECSLVSLGQLLTQFFVNNDKNTTIHLQALCTSLRIPVCLQIVSEFWSKAVQLWAKPNGKHTLQSLGQDAKKYAACSVKFPRANLKMNNPPYISQALA
jgi:hypothetical protein